MRRAAALSLLVTLRGVAAQPTEYGGSVSTPTCSAWGNAAGHDARGQAGEVACASECTYTNGAYPEWCCDQLSCIDLSTTRCVCTSGSLTVQFSLLRDECSEWALTTAAQGQAAIGDAGAKWCTDNCYRTDNLGARTLSTDCNLGANNNAWCFCTKYYCAPATDRPTLSICYKSTTPAGGPARRTAEDLEDLAPEETSPPAGPTSTCTPRTAPPTSAPAYDANGCALTTMYPTSYPTKNPTKYPTKLNAPPPAGTTVDAVVLTEATKSAPEVAALYNAPVVAKTVADITNAFDALTGVARDYSFGSLPAVTITFVADSINVASSTGAAAGSAAAAEASQTVTFKAEVNIGDILANVATYKAVYTLVIAQVMSVNINQISGLLFKRPGGVFFNRHANPQTQEQVDIQFQICGRLGCASPISSADYVSAIPADVLRVPAVTLAALRAAKNVTFAQILQAFPIGSTLRSDPQLPEVTAQGALPTIMMTVLDTPVQNSLTGTGVDPASLPAGTGLSFFYPVQMDWLGAVPNMDPATQVINGVTTPNRNVPAAKLLKVAYQLALADKLNINPYQVAGIRFVRNNGVTYYRRAGALQATERIAIDQVICPGLCTQQQAGNYIHEPATPPPSDDDTSIIVIAVVVPVVVIGIALGIYFGVCYRKDVLRSEIAELKKNQEARQAHVPFPVDEQEKAEEQEAPEVEEGDAEERK